MEGTTWGAATAAAFRGGDEAAALSLLKAFLGAIEQQQQHHQHPKHQRHLEKQPQRHLVGDPPVMLQSLGDLTAPMAFALQALEAARGPLPSLDEAQGAFTARPSCSFSSDSCQWGWGEDPLGVEENPSIGGMGTDPRGLRLPLLWPSLAATAHGLLLPWMGPLLQQAAETAQMKLQPQQLHKGDREGDWRCAVLLRRLLLAIESLAASAAAAAAACRTGGRMECLLPADLCCCKVEGPLRPMPSPPSTTSPAAEGLMRLLPIMLLLIEASSRAERLLPFASNAAAAVLQFLVQQQQERFLAMQGHRGEQSQRPIQASLETELLQAGISARRAALQLLMRLLGRAAAQEHQQQRQQQRLLQQLQHEKLQEDGRHPAEGDMSSVSCRCHFVMSQQLLSLLLCLATATAQGKAIERCLKDLQVQPEVTEILRGISLLQETAALAHRFSVSMRGATAAAIGKQHAASTTAAAGRSLQAGDEETVASTPSLGSPTSRWWGVSSWRSRLLLLRWQRGVKQQAEMLLQSTVDCLRLETVQEQQQHQAAGGRCRHCRAVAAAAALYFCCAAAVALEEFSRNQRTEASKGWASRLWQRAPRGPKGPPGVAPLLLKRALAVLPVLEDVSGNLQTTSSSSSSSNSSNSSKSCWWGPARGLLAFAVRLTAVGAFPLLSTAERHEAAGALAGGFEDWMLLPPLHALRCLAQQQQQQQQHQQQQKQPQQEPQPTTTAAFAGALRLLRLSPLPPLLGTAARQLGFAAATELSPAAAASVTSGPARRVPGEGDRGLCGLLYEWGCRLQAAWTLKETLSVHSTSDAAAAAAAAVAAGGLSAALKEVELLLGFVGVFSVACLRACLLSIGGYSQLPAVPQQQQQQQRWVDVIFAAVYVHVAVPWEAAAEAAALLSSLVLRAADTLPSRLLGETLLRGFAAVAVAGSCMQHALNPLCSSSSSSRLAAFPEMLLLQEALQAGGPLGEAASAATAMGALSRVLLLLEMLSTPPQPLLLLLPESAAQQQLLLLICRALHCAAMNNTIDVFAAAAHCCCCCSCCSSCAAAAAVTRISSAERQSSSNIGSNDEGLCCCLLRIPRTDHMTGARRHQGSLPFIPYRPTARQEGAVPLAAAGMGTAAAGDKNKQAGGTEGDQQQQQQQQQQRHQQQWLQQQQGLTNGASALLLQCCLVGGPQG